jgi:hypothetical protein
MRIIVVDGDILSVVMLLHAIVPSRHIPQINHYIRGPNSYSPDTHNSNNVLNIIHECGDVMEFQRASMHVSTRKNWIITSSHIHHIPYDICDQAQIVCLRPAHITRDMFQQILIRCSIPLTFRCETEFTRLQDARRHGFEWSFVSLENMRATSD